MSLKPSQCRAARALLGWSQEDLETRSQVAKRSIADFERESNVPYDRTLREIRLALEAGGVQFIAENGGGAGVRLKAAVPMLTRKRVSRFDRMASIAITYRGQEYQVRLSTNILDDMDRANHPTDAAFEKSMESHMNQILLTAAAAIDGSRVEANNMVLLTNEDFSEETGPRSPRTSTPPRLSVGQKFVGRNPPYYLAEIIQVEDDGRKAWVDLRTADGKLWDSSWVIAAQFLKNWQTAK